MLQFSSVQHAQSCLTPWDSMDCSTPGILVHYQLLDFTQTNVHWVSDAIQPSLPSVVPFSSCLQSFPASGSFQISQFFTSGGQSIGVSASASVLPMNTQDWFSLGLPGWMSLQFKRLKILLQNHNSKASRWMAFLLCFLPFAHLWPIKEPGMQRWGNIPQERHQFISVAQSYLTLWPHELQHARPPCPSPTPGVYSNSRPSSRWCHPAISSSVVPFSTCPQSLPASESFPMSQLFAWGSQSTGISALASFLPKNTQGWSPLEWTGWILQSKGLSRVFSNTTVQKHQFFGTQPSSQSNSHIHTWLLEKP